MNIMADKELLDIYDDNAKWIGVKPRDEVHREGYWHKTFHCWILYQDRNGKGYVLFQRRGPESEVQPNKLDISAAGHYRQGEDITKGLRELREELGVDAKIEQLIPVGIRVNCAHVDNILNREFQEVFLLKLDQPLNQYHLQHGEVSGLVAIPIDEGLQLLSGEVNEIQADALLVEGAPDGAYRTAERKISVKRSDIIHTKDNYYYKVLVLAKRALSGEKDLLI